MKIGSKGHYGLLALAELAANYRMRRAVQVKEIASNQNIPSAYLDQIMVILSALIWYTAHAAQPAGTFWLARQKPLASKRSCRY
jgi:hypothetical protein